MTFIHRIIGVLLAAGLIIPLYACQDRDVSMTITRAKPRDANCQIVTDDTLFLSHGVVDLVIATQYRLDIEIENNLIDVVKDGKGFSGKDSRINTTDIVITSAIIEYSSLDPLTANIAQKVSVPLSGSIPIGGSVTVGMDLLSASMFEQFRSAPEFLLIDQGEARPKRTSVELITRIRVKGETIDGREVESNEFLFPVTVCNGCSISFPPALLVEEVRRVTCPATLFDAEGVPIEFERVEICAARLGADGNGVDCQVCQQFAVDPFARQLCQPPE
jgi:hypothetical protein